MERSEIANRLIAFVKEKEGKILPVNEVSFKSAVEFIDRIINTERWRIWNDISGIESLVDDKGEMEYGDEIYKAVFNKKD